MDDHATRQARTPSGAERDYMIKIAREGIADWEGFLAGWHDLDGVDLAMCARWLLELLGTGQENPA